VAELDRLLTKIPQEAFQSYSEDDLVAASATAAASTVTASTASDSVIATKIAAAMMTASATANANATVAVTANANAANAASATTTVTEEGGVILADNLADGTRANVDLQSTGAPESGSAVPYDALIADEMAGMPKPPSHAASETVTVATASAIAPAIVPIDVEAATSSSDAEVIEEANELLKNNADSTRNISASNITKGDDTAAIPADSSSAIVIEGGYIDEKKLNVTFRQSNIQPLSSSSSSSSSSAASASALASQLPDEYTSLYLTTAETAKMNAAEGAAIRYTIPAALEDHDNADLRLLSIRCPVGTMVQIDAIDEAAIRRALQVINE
jgi:hypothetical protein